MRDELMKYQRLFRGRGDVWGHDEGRCVKEKLTDQHWEDHLTGRCGIGVYPAVPTPDGRVLCAWGCTDIDVEDFGAALLLRDTLLAANITSFIEKSRSKGYHVWLFTATPVTAMIMRYVQLVAHQVADMRPIEVNPKQLDVSPSKYGNYVRLPYMGGLVGVPERRVIVDDDQRPVPLGNFLDDALGSLNDPNHLAAIADMYVPPEPSRPVLHLSDSDDPSVDLANGMRAISPLGHIIWRDGPLEGRDRSTTLARLGHICNESGMSPSEARTVVASADRRWGKFHDRPDCDEQINKIIEKAYR